MNRYLAAIIVIAVVILGIQTVMTILTAADTHAICVELIGEGKCP